MFGSTVLDVAIGLVFVFLAVSLATSALTEAIASVTKLRQRTLRAGIQALLNDETFTGLARDLYNHALINPLADGLATKIASLKASPAYIDGSCFALALVGVIEAQKTGKPLEDIVDEVGNAQLRVTLQALFAQANGDRARFLAAIGSWFDDAMDRLGGWYKRYTQVIGFVVALLVSITLNADALRIAASLWQTPSLIAGITVSDQASAQSLRGELEKRSLLGWNKDTPFDPTRQPAQALFVVIGWLLVASAALFGAPFWFDTLQRITQIAGTGPTGGRTQKEGLPKR